MSNIVSNKVVFNQAGDFEAVRAAEAWCAERGISVGTMQRGEPRGLLLGDYNIQKWRNLDRHDRAALHGRMTGDMRNGPVTVQFDKELPESAHKEGA